MDLDPLKRRLVTRILAAMDTILGLCIFIIQIHRMWEYYYPFMASPTSPSIARDKDEDSKTATLFTFVAISLIVFATKLLQIFMGFGLLVATFGRNLHASIRISTWWLRTSIFIFITLVIKLFFTISDVVSIVTNLLGTEPFDYGLLIFGIIFRLFSMYWVTRFIIFLQWQDEFESYTSRHPHHRT